MGRKGNPSALLVAIRLKLPLWKTVWSFLKTLKMEPSYDPVISLLGSYPKNPETPIQKNLCTLMAKCWKQPKCPSEDEWIKKLWYVYTMEYYAAKRKKQVLLFATTWMELC